MATTPTVDQKLLWGRAAARCCFADCRVKLTESTGSGTYGEMCHIVAASSGGPRGKSILSDHDRNAYSNLILLCAHHHSVIDSLPSGPRQYPVEVLHRIKAEHERWVETTLAPSSDAAEVVYAQIIDDVSTGLDLAHWPWFSEHFATDLLPLSAVDQAAFIRARLLQVVWPGKYVDLEAAAESCMRSYVDLVTHFESFCETHSNGTWLQADGRYKRMGYNKNFEHWTNVKEVWSQLNLFNICRTVTAVNQFADQVRLHVNPHFFAAHGRFLVHDSLGYRGYDGPFLPSPDMLVGVEERLLPEMRRLRAESERLAMGAAHDVPAGQQLKKS